MKKAKIFYFSLTDEQTKDEKLQWFGDTKLGDISFENITPDKNNDWIDLAKNIDGFESLISLADKETRISKNIEKEKSVFKIYSNGINTSRDEWTYDFSKENLGSKLRFFIHEYNIEVDRWIDFRNKNRLNSVDESSPILSQFIAEKDIIKWSSRLKRDKLLKERKCEFNIVKIVYSLYRPFISKFLYFDYIPLDLVAQQAEIFPYRKPNSSITINTNSDQSFNILASAKMIDLHFIGDSVSFPLYRYDENGDRIDNITDWGLTQFQNHYSDQIITKLDIFHYTYAVLHHPAYRTKYELNLKREFPRLPFYENFHQWAAWGQELMTLHLDYETVEPYGLERLEIATKEAPKAKLKADKINGIITLDENTQLTGVPALAWEYKLGNRSALEWILDQYKEKKPKDPTIAKLFNTYKFADYKEQVIDLLQRVCTVSIRTMEIIQQMP